MNPEELETLLKVKYSMGHKIGCEFGTFTALDNLITVFNTDTRESIPKHELISFLTQLRDSNGTDRTGSI